MPKPKTKLQQGGGADAAPASNLSTGTRRLLGSLRKNVVSGSVVDSGVDIQVWTPTPLTALNVALTGEANRALPSGRVVELYGDESVGKTTLICMLLASAQRANGLACIFDTEATLSSERCRDLGVDTNDLLYGIDHTKDDVYIEGVLQGIINLVDRVNNSSENPTGIIALDTIAGTESRAESTKDVGEGTAFSPHARILSRTFRRLSIPLSQTRLTLVCCNQMKTGAIGQAFSSDREKEATLGGKALRFHSYFRIRMQFARKYFAPVDGKRVFIGNDIRVMLTKNKEGPSELRCTECVLILRKAPPNAGTFSPGLSALQTLVHWGLPAHKETGTVEIGGKKIAPMKFEERYANDAAFQAQIDRYLVAYRKARYSTEKIQQVNPDGEEEEEL